jgi:nitrite reductase/ring-hydroxylating ferredoxin subunit
MSDLVFVGLNAELLRRLQQISTAWLQVPDPATLDLQTAPQALVFELELKGSVEAIRRARERWPDALIAGALRLPIQELWHAAVAAGADWVGNWGALPLQLRRRTEAGTQLRAQARIRFPVLLNANTGDGLAGRLPDAPGGPVALFRIGGQLCAFRDVCPHEGASLADGPLDGKILTCPRHGSQFNVCTGSRMRGPADYAIRIYRVIVEGNAVFVEMDTP